MRAVFFFIFVFVLILIFVIGIGLVTGFFLHWVFPALEPGACFVGGILAQAFSLYLTAKLVDVARAFRQVEYRQDEEVLKEYRKQSKARRQPGQSKS